MLSMSTQIKIYPKKEHLTYAIIIDIVYVCYYAFPTLYIYIYRSPVEIHACLLFINLPNRFITYL